ncbi:MAG: 6-phosphofructokinase [Bacteroidales bacterium]|nr:6-phosphofructokinase [Bacteroidales bacterium]
MPSSTKAKRIGILTAGGDCPGINAAIRGVGKTAIYEYGMTVYGISSGFRGLVDNLYTELDEAQLSGILTLGGTILGTSRDKPFKGDPTVENKIPKLIKKNYMDLGLDALVVIGGNGTMKTAHKLSLEGLNIVGIPKTIDNDVWGTDVTFGFDSAVWIATEAIDRLHSTANSHKRIMVIELMGHHAGWLSLYAGVAGGGDVILLPEIDYDIELVTRNLERRAKSNKPYSIVVVAEGIKKPKGMSAAGYVSQSIREMTKLETRETILGYIQRGGTPTPMDRILSTRFGAKAVEMIAEGNYGIMVSKAGEHIIPVPLEEVGGKSKLVPADHPLIRKSRKMGISFGDRKM